MEKFAQEMIKNANAKAKEMLDEANRELSSNIEKREKELEKKNSEEISDYSKQMSEKKGEAIASANLDAKRSIEQAKEEKVREAVNRVVDYFPHFRSNPLYKKWINDAIKRGLDELATDNKHVTVHVAKGDKKLVASGIKVEEDLDDVGGVIIEAKEGKVRINYSFSQLLDTSMDEVRIRVNKELFG